MAEGIDGLIENPWSFWFLIIIASGVYVGIEFYLTGLLKEALKLIVLFLAVYGFTRHGQLGEEKTT
jgi:hypothetical protein